MRVDDSRVAEQEGVLAAATQLSVSRPGWRGGGGWSAPGGAVAGREGRGGRSGSAGALRPRRREEEGAVVGVLVQVGVGSPGLGSPGGRGAI